MWKNSVAHCEKIVKDDWQQHMGHFSVKDVPPIITFLAESDSES
jgi:uncharacterized protein YkwD